MLWWACAAVQGDTARVREIEAKVDALVADCGGWRRTEGKPG